MLTKLLKYDLKYMIQNMSVFYILAIVFAITTRILFSLEETFIIKLLGQISVGCMVSMVASIMINVIMRSWVRFKDSLYKDESYLTHTLPVSKKDIYESKFIQALLFTLFSFCIMIISIFITYYTPERFDIIKNAINSMVSGLNLNTWFIIISLIVILFLELFNLLQNGFLGIILGHRKNSGKVGYSVLYGFIIYSFSQLFVVICLLIFGLFNSEILELFRSSPVISSSVMKTLLIFSTIIYTLVILFNNIICVKILEKGVDVE